MKDDDIFPDQMKSIRELHEWAIKDRRKQIKIVTINGEKVDGIRTKKR